MSRDKPNPRDRWARTTAAQGELRGDPAHPYDGIGHQLRLAREQAGQDLDAVANYLRIRPPLLQAIEEGRFEELPGRIYAIGFLRTYSTHLGLDSAAVIGAFKAESTAEPRGEQLVFPAPAPETRLPGGWVVLLALLIAGGAYGGWYYAHRQDARQLSDVPPPPIVGATTPPAPGELPVAPVINPAPPAGSGIGTDASPTGTTPSHPDSAAGTTGSLTVPNAATPPAGVMAPAGTLPLPAITVPGAPAPAPAGGATLVPPLTPPAPAAAATAPETAPSPAETATEGATGQVFGAVGQPSRVVLIAHADSWIDIRGAHNEVLFPGRVLRPGDSYRVPNRTDALLWTGNLGALEIRIDGKPIPKLGSYGEARRNISLDPARLLAGTARNR